MVKTNVASIKSAQVKMPEQNILFIGPEDTNLSDVIKLMSGAPRLKRTAAAQIVNNDQNTSSTKPIKYAELNMDSGETVHLIEINHLFQMSLIKRHWASKSLGVILFVDLAVTTPLEAMKKTLTDFASYFKDLSISIGVINNDNITDFNLSSVNQHLNKLQYNVAVFDIDTSNYSEISLLVQSMLISNLYGIQCSS